MISANCFWKRILSMTDPDVCADTACWPTHWHPENKHVSTFDTGRDREREREKCFTSFALWMCPDKLMDANGCQSDSSAGNGAQLPPNS